MSSTQAESEPGSVAVAQSPVARRRVVAPSDRVPEGGRFVATIAGTTLGVFRVRGSLYAYENRCAHQGGPVCQGRVFAGVVEDLDEQRRSVGHRWDPDDLRIVCPWHGFEFRIDTGRHAGQRKIGLRSFPVEEQDGQIYVTV